MRFKLSWVIIASLAVVLSFQNCTDTRFSERSQASTDRLKSNDGQVFDGKLRVLHHYQDHFTCNDVAVPESILFTEDQIHWVLIQNSETQCFHSNGVAVEGVVYNEASKTATYQGKLYVPPRPYFVDATADPNSSDAFLRDGICANNQGFCSLRAAIEQSLPTALSDDVIVHVPSGQFKLDRPLTLVNLFPESHQITVRGAGPDRTILDGNGISAHFEVRSTAMKPINIESLKLQNGHANSPGDHGTSITYHFGSWVPSHLDLDPFLQRVTSLYPQYDEMSANPWKSELNIFNCVFENNKNGNVIYAGPLSGNLNITQAQFIDNSGHGVYSRLANSLTINESLFMRQDSRGVAVDLNKSHVLIRKTTFQEGYMGADMTGCRQCLLEEVEALNNRFAGLSFSKGKADDLLVKYTVRGSRLLDNSSPAYSPLMGTANLMVYPGTQLQVEIYDSVLSMADVTKKNCHIYAAEGVSNPIRLFNTTVSDASCGP